MAGDTFPKPKSCKTPFLTAKAFRIFMLHTNTPWPCKSSNQEQDQNEAKRVSKPNFAIISRDLFVCLFLWMPSPVMTCKFFLGKKKTIEKYLA